MNPAHDASVRAGVQPWRGRSPRWQRLLVLAATAIVVGCGGCAGLPESAERPFTHSLSGLDNSPLAQLVSASTQPGQRQLSGFAFLDEADDALAARLMLIRRASRSLDLQVYQFEGDRTGSQVLRELAAAADRGVRVRLLIDDLHAGKVDALLSAFDRHHHIEVRLFNPLPVRGRLPLARALLSLHHFERINRRMHNKLFIADGQLAIVGGRNIGDDYFMRGTAANFIDLDVLAAGAVVPALADLFDAFWNDPLAYSIASLVPTPATALPDAAAGGRFALTPAPGARATGRIAAQIEGGRLELHFAKARLFADAPAKAALDGSTERPGVAMAQALELMRAASVDVTIASPYFVPGPLGLALMKEARNRGIGLSVMTNSLAATDEPMVHQGYQRYRLAMLKMGVRLSELGPVHREGIGAIASAHSSLGRLHAKLTIVDHRWLLVGSMNMDLRSSRINTELVLAIDSPALADAADTLLQEYGSSGNYQLQLGEPDGHIEWISTEGERTVVHGSEPHQTWLNQLRRSLVGNLVPEYLL